MSWAAASSCCCEPSRTAADPGACLDCWLFAWLFRFWLLAVLHKLVFIVHLSGKSRVKVILLLLPTAWRHYALAWRLHTLFLRVDATQRLVITSDGSLLLGQLAPGSALCI